MNIEIITPAPPRSRKGNRITALRWSKLLRELGHRIRIHQVYNGGNCDVMIALHAKRSFRSIQQFNNTHPNRPIVLALTGTDLYNDIHTSKEARVSVNLADRIVILQKGGLTQLSPATKCKTHVIYQSVEQTTRRRATSLYKRRFNVCVIGHLRPVKDPFRAARAAKLLPTDSRVYITHVGQALSDAMHRQAIAEHDHNPRYRWVGEQPRWKARWILAQSHLLVLTSKDEGGANVISEAISAGVPVISSRISGSIGILGKNYPGYFPVGDTQALAKILRRTETDRKFLRDLASRCSALRSLVSPAREKSAWRELLRDLPKA